MSGSTACGGAASERQQSRLRDGSRERAAAKLRRYHKMRLYQPAGTVETLERVLADEAIRDSIVAHRVLPERPAQTAPFPTWLDKRLVRALHSQGIEMLYTHQAESVAALH